MCPKPNPNPTNINSPIEQGRHNTSQGRPSAISTMADVGLTARQQALLNDLPDTGAEAVVKRGSVSMTDLAALSAATGDEFAMFTKRGTRLIVRGDERRVYIGGDRAIALNAEGYRFSGHTHTMLLHNGMELEPSGGDYEILGHFDHEYSVIYNIKGQQQKYRKLLHEGV